MIRKFLTAAVAAVAALVAAPATSQAVFTLTVTGPGGAVVAPDAVGVVVPGVGDQNPAFRQITIPGSVAATSLGPFITVGSVSGTAFESAAFSNVIESTISLTNNGPVTAAITITVTETAFALPAGSSLTAVQQLSLNSVFSPTGTEQAGPGTGLVSLITASTVEGVPVTSQLINQSTGPATDTDTVTGIPRLGPTFGIQNIVVVTLAPGATVTFQNSLTVTGVTPPGVIPVPAGLVMAATAVPFFGLIRRRLRGAGAPAAAA